MTNGQLSFTFTLLAAEMKISSIGLLLCWMTVLSLDNSIVLGQLPSVTSFLAFNNYLFFLLFLLPLLGLITDTWIGRHKLIIGCFYLSLATATLVAVNLIIKISLKITIPSGYSLFLSVVFTLGFIAVRANIVLYYIEILVIKGASSKELSSIIYWHFLSIIAPALVYHMFSCLLSHYGFHLVISILQVANVFIADAIFIASHILLREKFKESGQFNKLNPIKLIVRVLCYARKHKYPENRSALTYWEEEAPSRLDLGKEKYGGPFTEEQVEDVKTVFRIVPLLISVLSFTISMEIFDNSKYIKKEDSYCIFEYYAVRFIVSIVYIIMYRIFFWKFQRIVPSMLKRITIGLILLLTSCILYTIIEAVAYLKSNSYSYNETEDINITDNGTILPSISSYWTILPYLLYALSYVFTFITSLEFVIAQTPYHMRGVLVGLWYAAVGLGLIISENLNFIYVKYLLDSKPSPQFYMYLTRSLITLVVIIAFAFLIKHYQLRITKKEIDIYSVIGRTYSKYMRQEDDYDRSSYKELI